MANGKHVKQSSHINSYRRRGAKSLTLTIAVILLAAMVIGGSIAWLSMKSEPAVNKFTLASVTCDIGENCDDDTKKDVWIYNTGDTDAYIRVAVVANKVDDEGNIIGAGNDTFTLGTDWMKIGNYYYFTKKVAPGAKTEDLLGSDISLVGNNVTIIADAIQADPAKAVEQSWGVKVTSGVITGAAN